MGSVNKVLIIGNLGKDPEVRYTGQGQAVANFSIACNEKWTGKDGQKHEKVEWINIVAWAAQAENAGKYLAKGRQVYIEGKLQTRKWTDKEGRDRWTTEVVAQNIVYLGGKTDGQAEAQAETQASEARPAQPAQQARSAKRPASPAPAREPGGDDAPPPSDDDVPF